MLLGTRHGVFMHSQSVSKSALSRERNQDLWTAVQHVSMHPKELHLVAEDRRGQWLQGAEVRWGSCPGRGEQAASPSLLPSAEVRWRQQMAKGEPGLFAEIPQNCTCHSICYYYYFIVFLNFWDIIYLISMSLFNLKLSKNWQRGKVRNPI